jgi:hypothetical protein
MIFRAIGGRCGERAQENDIVIHDDIRLYTIHPQGSEPFEVQARIVPYDATDEEMDAGCTGFALKIVDGAERVSATYKITYNNLLETTHDGMCQFHEGKWSEIAVHTKKPTADDLP